MQYRINVAESVLCSWSDTGRKYVYYFRIYADSLQRAERIIKDLRTIYRAPDYDITLYRETATSEKVTL